MRDRAAWTPLHCAAEKNHVMCVDALIKAGAIVDSKAGLCNLTHSLKARGGDGSLRGVGGRGGGGGSGGRGGGGGGVGGGGGRGGGGGGGGGGGKGGGGGGGGGGLVSNP
jgi:hypothetical protein